VEGDWLAGAGGGANQQQARRLSVRLNRVEGGSGTGPRQFAAFTGCWPVAVDPAAQGGRAVGGSRGGGRGGRHIEVPLYYRGERLACSWSMVAYARATGWLAELRSSGARRRFAAAVFTRGTPRRMAADIERGTAGGGEGTADTRSRWAGAFFRHQADGVTWSGAAGGAPAQRGGLAGFRDATVSRVVLFGVGGLRPAEAAMLGPRPADLSGPKTAAPEPAPLGGVVMSGLRQGRMRGQARPPEAGGWHGFECRGPGSALREVKLG